MNDLHVSVARLEEKVDAIHAMLTERAARFDALSDRVAAVERRVWWASGAMAALGYIADKLFHV